MGGTQENGGGWTGKTANGLSAGAAPRGADAPSPAGAGGQEDVEPDGTDHSCVTAQTTVA